MSGKSIFRNSVIFGITRMSLFVICWICHFKEAIQSCEYEFKYVKKVGLGGGNMWTYAPSFSIFMKVSELNLRKFVYIIAIISRNNGLASFQTMDQTVSSACTPIRLGGVTYA
jgi:hypothetical protein